MKRFASLFNTIDQSTKTAAQVNALAEYFNTATEADRLWAIALFSGRRPKRAVTTAKLRDWGVDAADIPLWLFDECHSIAGDLAETIALVLPPNKTTDDRSLSYWISALRDLNKATEATKKAFVQDAWATLGGTERFIFNKLVTGGMRVEVSQKLMTRALARATDRDKVELAHRLMGDWHPDDTSWYELFEAEDINADAARPYPFHLADQLEGDPETLGSEADWHAEWKWDGIRGQLILRSGEHSVWSRSNELMTDRFPELARGLDFLPAGTVLDGELLVWYPGATHPASFQALQSRIGRKTAPKKLLYDAPVVLQAYDLLEWQGNDVRARPFAERRAMLEAACADLPSEAPVRLSPQLEFTTWNDLAHFRDTARAAHAEGLMLKRAQSPYLADRENGAWWKWTVAPLTIDAVMIYAQAGSEQHANLFTDFTFAVRSGNDLVPFTKAEFTLTDAERREITAWVRKNTTQRFGPVRQVTPEHVFEIAFDGIQVSPRHKSGVTLRFPRILRWCKDKTLQEANTLEDLTEMLRIYG
ncbi:ATP-dependent DNA ligase [Sulfitobacter sp. SK012]|uniref:ATP-dependent DNA ligase n=1 Tax=Sulfitobacter sp. SK012 TaxID=1389005 RepID=UPI000E0B2A58|nr:ATP-dependent DNA ligase [Sulfitobacter sp. SK012]AXI45970.1 ATP-dependent DNA ligase [Sulfitobacter sp. SK012]